jgi:hypothetical protein
MNIILAQAAAMWQELRRRHLMVHRKRTFTEIDGQKLLEATETFGSSVVDAQQNAPFGSEIFRALEALSIAIRHVQVTLTGDPGYGSATHHNTSFTAPPPKTLKFRTWKTVPLWQKQDQKG